MSDTDTGDGPAGGDNSAVSEVLNALTPLTEQMDTFDGFAVKHGPKSEPGRAPDPDVVEVRFVLTPPRHGREVQRARGMLQGHGYTVQKVKRGGERHIRSVLRVWVGDGDPPTERTGARDRPVF